MRKRATRSSQAFTLVELLVVIGIIGMLVAILVPVVQTAKIHAENVRAGARITQLGDGCEMYYKDEEYYPGQKKPERMPDESGSEVMVDLLRQGGYTEFKHGDVIEIDGHPNAASDRRSTPMAILYYPSRLGQSGLDQYVYADNRNHTKNKMDLGFNKYIKDTRYEKAVRPYGDEKFLIIGAGWTPKGELKYFTNKGSTYPDF